MIKVEIFQNGKKGELCGDYCFCVVFTKEGEEVVTKYTSGGRILAPELFSGIGSVISKELVSILNGLKMSDQDIKDTMQEFAKQITEEAENCLQKGNMDEGSGEGVGASVEPGEH